MAKTLEELKEQIAQGKRRCVCTEEYYCNTCREEDNLKELAQYQNQLKLCKETKSKVELEKFYIRDDLHSFRKNLTSHTIKLLELGLCACDTTISIETGRIKELEKLIQINGD